MALKFTALIALAAGLAALPAQAADKKDDDKDVAPIAIPAPPAGKGQIVFFRPGGMGFALGCSVNENGQKISSLGAGKYFVLVTEPGKHEYTVKSEAKDALTLEVEADETQYAKCRIKMGIMVGRPDLAPATEAEFRESKKLKLVDDEDMGPGPGALRAADMAAALAPKPAAAVEAPAAPAEAPAAPAA
jgi:hypothetical protein